MTIQIINELLTRFNQRMFTRRCYHNVTKMTIGGKLMNKIYQPGFKKLVHIFKSHGFEMRIVGGAVRDVLVGLKPRDVDIATIALPEEMQCMFYTEKITMCNVNDRHGTVTVRIGDSIFDCSTLRLANSDMNAKTQFVTDWELDAKRRDLTVNSMHLGMDGTIYDYCNGIEDLKLGVVKFVGNASDAISADYLRILRYFRFFGRISKSGIYNEEAIEAIKKECDGLKFIAGERIYSEVQKIVTGRFASQNLAKMKECGIFPYIGLPETFHCANFHKIYECSNVSIMKVVSVLAAGLSSIDDSETFLHRLKCTKKERDIINFIVENRHKKELSKLSERKLKLILINFYKDMTDMSMEYITELFVELLLYNDYKGEIFAELLLPDFPAYGENIEKTQTVYINKIKQLQNNFIPRIKSNIEVTGKIYINNQQKVLNTNRFVDNGNNILLET